MGEGQRRPRGHRPREHGRVPVPPAAGSRPVATPRAGPPPQDGATWGSAHRAPARHRRAGAATRPRVEVLVGAPRVPASARPPAGSAAGRHRRTATPRAPRPRRTATCKSPVTRTPYTPLHEAAALPLDGHLREERQEGPRPSSDDGDLPGGRACPCGGRSRELGADPQQHGHGEQRHRTRYTRAGTPPETRPSSSGGAWSPIAARSRRPDSSRVTPTGPPSASPAARTASPGSIATSATRAAAAWRAEAGEDEAAGGAAGDGSRVDATRASWAIATRAVTARAAILATSAPGTRLRACRASRAHPCRGPATRSSPDRTPAARARTAARPSRCRRAPSSTRDRPAYRMTAKRAECPRRSAGASGRRGMGGDHRGGSGGGRAPASTRDRPAYRTTAKRAECPRRSAGASGPRGIGGDHGATTRPGAGGRWVRARTKGQPMARLRRREASSSSG
jgi:hypothetical protein